MAPTRANNPELLARVNFPLYSLQMVTDRHVLVAGGGGSSNSGVKNGFEIFEVSNNGNKLVSEHVVRHLTGSSAVMNCATFNNGKHIYLVAGQEGHCQLYNVVPEVVDADNGTLSKEYCADNLEASTKDVRHRKKTGSDGISQQGEQNETRNSSSKNTDHNKDRQKRITFCFKPNDCIQTDFSPVEPVQKVVRISPGLGRLMVTGGNDGHLRVWNFPALTLARDIAAHAAEVDDLDISPDGSLVASVSRDKQTLLTSLLTGKRVSALRWEAPQGATYVSKRCRFGIVEGRVDKPRLFVIANPTGPAAKMRSVLQLWDPAAAALVKATHFGEPLSALAVSADGRLVAVGTMLSGHVSVHVAFSLRRVLHVPRAHNMFVTALLFLPRANDGAADGPPIAGQPEAEVLSVSVDNRVRVHTLRHPHSVPVWVAMLLIVGTLFVVFILCSLADI